ncbi:MAG: ABC transporter ATP-binding protein [Bacteroides sp.]|nr:ABC transporter ATP-binding protein [Bacteroides sp.]MDD4055166.1 ABC transporter ATP-binding protein [Bacteroides sp.]MDD4720866.1 ABC transporter ATP-binding protein [Bacteroides sp.]
MVYPNAVECTGLTRHFKERTAVRDLHLEIPNGEAFGLLGHNGAGKTTTIRMLLGLLSPSSGSIKVLGCRVPSQANLVRAKAGALLESHGLYQNISAWDNLRYYSEINRLNKKETKIRISHLLSIVGLWEYRKENVSMWSKGMKQRLALARALIGDPDIIFLDEPFSGLDPQSVKTIRELLLYLSSERHCTIILSSHNLNEVERICNRVGIMRQGELVTIGEPANLSGQLMNNPKLETKIICSGVNRILIDKIKGELEFINEITLESPEIITVDSETNEEINKIIKILIDDGVLIKSIESNKKTLEDAYMTVYERDDNSD